MNISLTPELERIVKAKVDSGLYDNASEVIREALRFMAEHARFEEMKCELLRAEIDQAWKQAERGEFVSATPESIIAQADEAHGQVCSGKAG